MSMNGMARDATRRLARDVTFCSMDTIRVRTEDLRAALRFIEAVDGSMVNPAPVSGSYEHEEVDHP